MIQQISIGLAIFVGVLYFKNRAQKGYQKISAEEAKEKLKNKDTVLLDVRTPFEYDQGHIPKSKLVPLNELRDKVSTVVPDKNKEIIVYCRTGSRSTSASNTLLKLGYKNVYDLGGIIKWPYEVKK